MPENSINKDTPLKIFGERKHRDYVHNNEKQKYFESYNWNNSQRHEDVRASSENVQEIVSNLLAMKIISDDTSALLKKETMSPQNPALIMDLRHEMIYSDHRAEVQVASDFYDLRLQERVFTHWVRAVCMERVETLHKQKKAATHYNRKLLEHTWKCWQNLSKVLHMEREREQRKQIWRMKVEEVLPDFKPARAVDW
ncbi:coiled-coil domain-containing protein 191 isoform X2 [Periplaneta americana]|uniref:coiled-coil domain-containing protein 191 isoform X2 n=1 Tax=Periplaneta americana TaxID=6978 RepID=UPI0037E8F3CC